MQNSPQTTGQRLLSPSLPHYNQKDCFQLGIQQLDNVGDDPTIKRDPKRCGNDPGSDRLGDNKNISSSGPSDQLVIFHGANGPNRVPSGDREFPIGRQNEKSNQHDSDIDEIELSPKNKQIKEVNQIDFEIKFNDQNCEFNQKRPTLQERVTLVMESDVYKYVHLFFLTAFMVSLLIYNFNPNSAIPTPGYNGDAVLASFYIEIFCQVFFLFHLIITIAKYPKIEYEWFVLDLTTTVVGIVALFLASESFNLTTGTTVGARNFLMAYRVLKLLMFIKLSSTISTPANNVVNSLKSVGKILVPALCFIYMYAVVGLYSFSNYEYNRCRPSDTINLSENWPVYTNEVFLCGSRQCPASYSCLNPIDYGVDPNRSELYQIQLGNSLLTYENIFYALLSTLKEVFVTGGVRLIILQKQATNFIFVEIYYLSFIYLLSYIYLNIFYGLMMSNEEEKVETDDENEAPISINQNLDGDDIRESMNRTMNGNFRETTTSKFRSQSRHRTHKSNLKSSKPQQTNSKPSQGNKIKVIFGRGPIDQEQDSYKKGRESRNAMSQYRIEQQFPQPKHSEEESERGVQIAPDKLRDINTTFNVEDASKNIFSSTPKSHEEQNDESENSWEQNEQRKKRRSQYGIINLAGLNKKSQEEESVPDIKEIVQVLSPNMLIPMPDKLSKDEQKESSKASQLSVQNETQNPESEYCINWNRLHELYVYFNHIVIILGCINLALEFKGQSAEFEFVVDSIDFGFYILFFIYCALEIVFYALRVKKYNEGKLIRQNLQVGQVEISKNEHQSSASSLNRNQLIKENNQSPGVENKSFDQEISMSNGEDMQELPLPILPKALILEILLLLICTVGIVYQAIGADSIQSFLRAENQTVKLFRTFKYLRIIVLLISRRYFTESRIIVISIFTTVYKIRNFIIFWMLMVIIFAIMGFHMFAYRTQVDYSTNTLDLKTGSSFPISFNGIYSSLVFTLLAFYNEEWDYFMFQQYLGSGPLIVIWQIISVFIGLTILSKYFMALLMKELGDELDRVEEESMTPEIRQRFRKRSIKLSQQVNRNNAKEDFIEQKEAQSNSVHPIDNIIDNNAGNTKHEDSNNNQFKNSVSFQLSKESPVANGSKGTPSRRQSILDDPIGPIKKQINRKVSALTKEIDFTNLQDDIKPNDQEIAEQTEYHEESFGVVLISRLIRVFKIILEHRYYKLVRMFVILMSMLDLMIRHPQVNPSSTTYIVLQNFDKVVQAFFLVSLVAELLSYGLFADKHSYLRKSWVNWANLLIVIIEILTYMLFSHNEILHKIETIKVLRILYYIEMRYDTDRNMRLTLVGFRRLVPKILTLLGVTIIFYGFFALLLVKFYKNSFSYCHGVDLNTSQMTISSNNIQMSVTINDRNDCLLWGGDWIQYRLNATNFFSSLLYCFLSVTTQGWTLLSIAAASLRGQDLQPIQNANSYAYIFFMVFFFFGNMIMLNVFVGLTMNNFKKIKEEVTGQAKLTKVEKEWLSIKRQIYRLEPQILDKSPQHPVRWLCYEVVKSRPYTVLKSILFGAFVVSMSLFTTNMDSTYFNALIITKFFFVGLEFIFYVLELMAFGIRPGNLRTFIFETSLLLYALLYGILLLTIDVSKDSKKICGGILIAMLFVNYFEILNEFNFVKKMMNSLISILPQTTNLLIIILCTLFIYTIVGMELFSYLRTNEELNSFDQNYRNFQTALFSLVKFSLMESSIGQVSDAAQGQGPDFICHRLVSYDQFKTYGQMGCGSPAESYLFFLSFHVIYSLILMSTMIAIIFDAYSEVRREQEAMVNKFQLLQVKEEWKTYDSEATGYISYRDFWMFTAKLVKIYEVDKEQMMSSETKQTFLQSLSIPIYEHNSGILCFQFHQVIEALTRVVFKRKNGNEMHTKNADKMFKDNQTFFMGGEKLKRSCYDSSHVLTLIILKSGLRVWKKKSKMENSEYAPPLYATNKIKEKIDQEREQQIKMKEEQAKRQEQQARLEEQVYRKKHKRRNGTTIFESEEAVEPCDKNDNTDWINNLEVEIDHKNALYDQFKGKKSEQIHEKG